MQLINGQPVPEHLTIQELEYQMNSSDMQTFCLACEALRNAGSPAAYEILKQHINSTDKHKRRYVLSIIFDYPQSLELLPYLTEALHSHDRIFVTTALGILIDGKAPFTDEDVLCCFEKNKLWMDSYDYQLLERLEKTVDHTERIISLFNTAATDSVRIAIAECLESYTSTENHLILYDLFYSHSAPKIRMSACRIAHQFDRHDLLQKFSKDPDRHIRKYLKQVSKT